VEKGVIVVGGKGFVKWKWRGNNEKLLCQEALILSKLKKDQLREG
jgi:hypothetical protein